MITEKDVLSALARGPGPDGQTPLPQSGAIAGVTTVGVTWGFFPREAIDDADVVIDEVPALEAYLMGAA